MEVVAPSLRPSDTDPLTLIADVSNGLALSHLTKCGPVCGPFNFCPEQFYEINWIIVFGGWNYLKKF